MTRKLKEHNFEIELMNQHELRELEQLVVDGVLENLPERIEDKRVELVNQLTEYAKNNTIIKYTKDGEPYEAGIDIKPIVINNYFFKPIVPHRNKIPTYNAENLGLVYDYYSDIVAEVNMRIGEYPPTLSTFAKFAGITTNELRNYRNSNDIGMRIVVDKIYDEIGDNNLTMSQMGKLNERTTIFRLKSQNEMIEKAQPTVSINITEEPDLDAINKRLDSYKKLLGKK